MNKLKVISGLLLCCTCIIAVPGVASELLIAEGEPDSELLLFSSAWKQSQETFVGSGVGNAVSSTFLIGAGDFEISATLQLKTLSGSAASFFLEGGHFGFDGRSRQIFLEGDGFPKKSLGASADFVTAGKEFTLTVTRTGDQLRIGMDDREVTSFVYPANRTAQFGLRPHRNEMRIRTWSFKGDKQEQQNLEYVFASGRDGYKVYRIPSLIKTKWSTLLAFCEGRVDGAGDAGNIDLVMKRSISDGETWGDLQVIRDIGHTAGNPCPVVDVQTGKIVLLFNESDSHEGEVLSGKAKRRAFVCYSEDDGKTWSNPENITASVNPGGQYNWLACGPGVGIQIQEGTYTGRMVVPVANSIGRAYGTHCIFSDDRGETWKASSGIEGGCNESQLVELSDGRLMMNMRMQQNGTGFRAISYSSDGGETWSELVHDDELNCPRCQASVIRHHFKGKIKLIFSNPAGGGRKGMTIKASHDGGVNWSAGRLVYPYSSAYSCLSMAYGGDLLCLFEGGHRSYSSSGIALVRFPVAELFAE